MVPHGDCEFGTAVAEAVLINECLTARLSPCPDERHLAEVESPPLYAPIKKARLGL